MLLRWLPLVSVAVAVAGSPKKAPFWLLRSAPAVAADRSPPAAAAIGATTVVVELAADLEKLLAPAVAAAAVCNVVEDGLAR